MSKNEIAVLEKVVANPKELFNKNKSFPSIEKFDIRESSLLPYIAKIYRRINDDDFETFLETYFRNPGVIQTYRDSLFFFVAGHSVYVSDRAISIFTIDDVFSLDDNYQTFMEIYQSFKTLFSLEIYSDNEIEIILNKFLNLVKSVFNRLEETQDRGYKRSIFYPGIITDHLITCMSEFLNSNYKYIMEKVKTQKIPVKLVDDIFVNCFGVFEKYALFKAKVQDTFNENKYRCLFNMREGMKSYSEMINEFKPRGTGGIDRMPARRTPGPNRVLQNNNSSPRPRD